MAILRKGILGGVANKVGNVVGYSARGLDIVRAYAIPTNPRTDKQMAQRNLLMAITKPLSWLWAQALKDFWDKLQSGRTVTGWSRACQLNLQTMAGTFDFTRLIVMWGPLPPVVGITAQGLVVDGAKKIRITASASAQEQLSGKYIHICAIYEPAMMGMSFRLGPGAATVYEIELPSLVEWSDLHLYWFYEDTAMNTSPSQYLPFTPPV